MSAPVERVVPAFIVGGVIEVGVIAVVTTMIDAVCLRSVYMVDDELDRPTISFASVC